MGRIFHFDKKDWAKTDTVDNLKYAILRLMRTFIGFLLLLGVGVVATLFILIYWGTIDVSWSYVFIPGFIILLILGVFSYLFLWLITVGDGKIYDEAIEERVHQEHVDEIAKQQREQEENKDV